MSHISKRPRPHIYRTFWGGRFDAACVCKIKLYTHEKPILSSFQLEWSQILQKLIMNPSPEIMKCFFTTGSNSSLFSSIIGEDFTVKLPASL